MKLLPLLVVSVTLFGYSVVTSSTIPIDKVTFRLYTKLNNNLGEELFLNDTGSSLRGSTFDASNPTRFVIHGWKNHASSPINVNIRNAYFDRPDSFNVIIVDWSFFASNPNYISAALHVPAVGSLVAEMIRSLSVPTELVTVIGHSLGAHVAGHAGKSLTGEDRLGSIVALDPANPLFANTPFTIAPVGKGDALYVQSIQTNRGMMGQAVPVGHSSFFPNFGPLQPGCPLVNFTKGGGLPGLCDHERSHQLFAESLSATDDESPFLARKCSTGFFGILLWTCLTSDGSTNRIMGGDPLDNGAEGVYYMKTNSRSPFSRGSSGIVRGENIFVVIFRGLVDLVLGFLRILKIV